MADNNNLVLVLAAVVAVLVLTGGLRGSYSGALGLNNRNILDPGSYTDQSQGEGPYSYATYSGDLTS